jgi:hypothetical protein
LRVSGTVSAEVVFLSASAIVVFLGYCAMMRVDAR